MLSVKQGGIKYHFLSLWYYSTWDWTQVYRTIGEHSNHRANLKVNVIACLEFELDYFETTVQHFSHDTTGNPFQINYLKPYNWVQTNNYY